jgi:hypothetical protein
VFADECIFLQYDGFLDGYDEYIAYDKNNHEDTYV